MKTRTLLYFGPLTVCIEWIGLILGSLYVQEFSLNQPISILSVAQMPLPFIFSSTLTLAGASYFVFSFALRPFSRYTPLVAFIAGAALSLTGFIPFTGDGSLDTIHSICIQIAIAGYCVLIWLMRAHPIKSVSKITPATLLLLLATNLGAIVSIFIIHKYTAILQLLMLFIIQFWTILIVWHSRLTK